MRTRTWAISGRAAAKRWKLKAHQNAKNCVLEWKKIKTKENDDEIRIRTELEIDEE